MTTKFDEEFCTASPPTWLGLDCEPVDDDTDPDEPPTPPNQDEFPPYSWLATDGYYRLVDYELGTHGWNLRTDGFYDIQTLPTSHGVYTYESTVSG